MDDIFGVSLAERFRVYRAEWILHRERSKDGAGYPTRQYKRGGRVGLWTDEPEMLGGNNKSWDPGGGSDRQ